MPQRKRSKRKKKVEVVLQKILLKEKKMDKIKLSLSNQEIFDKAVTHLHTQGKRSVNEEGDCLYRNADGLKCVAGIFIPDEKYHPEMEGKPSHLIIETKEDETKEDETKEDYFFFECSSRNS